MRKCAFWRQRDLCQTLVQLRSKCYVCTCTAFRHFYIFKNGLDWHKFELWVCTVSEFRFEMSYKKNNTCAICLEFKYAYNIVCSCTAKSIFLCLRNAFETYFRPIITSFSHRYWLNIFKLSNLNKLQHMSICYKKDRLL